MTTCNVTWTTNGIPCGESFQITTTGNSGNNTIWVGDPPPYNPYPNQPWTTPGVGSSNQNPTPPSPIFTCPPFEEEDEDGKRIVRSPAPSLELILVEIAKVLREGGDILEVREIFERHKLKLVDHDGEVIFDPKDVDNLEDKGL